MDNHNTKQFDVTELQAYCDATDGVQLLQGIATTRPPVALDRSISR